MRVLSWIGRFVLGWITAMFLLALFGCILNIRAEKAYYRDGIVEIRGFRLERIGDFYGDSEAGEGYTYYRMLTEAENISQFTEDENYVWRYYKGSEYDDVREEETDSDDIFSYADRELIPAGRSVLLEDIFLIRNGVDEITVLYNCGYGDEEKTRKIEVP